MPVKFIDEKTGEFLDTDAMKQSGAPRAYGIKSVEDLVKSSLPKDGKSYNIFRPKL